MRTPWILLLLLLSSPALAQLDEAPEIDEETLFELALPKVEQLYLHPDAIDPTEMARAGIQAMEAIGPRVLVLETAPGELQVQVDARTQTFRIDDVTDLTGLRHRLEEVVAFAVAGESGLDAEALRVEALDGLLRTIDRHSRLIVGGRLDEFDTRYKGTLVGIGARIGRRAGFLRVLLPFADAPAGRAGLQAMDIISHIDGQSTAAMSVEDAVDRIRGPEGVPVLLTIQRDGEEGRRVFVIVREKVLVPSVESERLDGGVGYVVIDHFSQKTSEEFASHVEAMSQAGELRGIIIDLRGNTGGSMRQSARIVNAFVEEGVLIRTEGRGNKPVKNLTPRVVAAKKSKLFDGPVAVLVNSRTASGSEIVAGGLKFLERSITIGTQSFGKGTVQKVYALRTTGQRASLKLTVARYLLPDDAYINSVGVTPDVVTGQVWLDAREPTLPDAFREPPANRGAGAGNGGLDARKNPGSGRAVLDEGINAGAVLRLWYPRVLDGWSQGDDDDSAEPTSGERPPGWADHPGEAGDDLFNDMELRLAYEVLRAAPADARREELLDLAAPIVAEWQIEQGRRMQEAAAARALRWAPSKNPSWMDRAPARAERRQQELQAPPPAVEATLHLPEAFEAGADAVATLVVKNTSGGALQHLRARVESSTDILDGASFLIGDLDRGDTGRWELPLTISTGAPTRLDDWRLYLLDDSGPLGGPFLGVTATRGKRGPDLALKVSSAATPQEDGSVVIEASVSVRNESPGEATDVRVRFAEPADDDIERIERFRQTGVLKQGESETLTLSLRVRNPASHPDVEIRLRATDGRSGESTTVALHLPSSGASPPTPWLSPPTVTLRTPRDESLARGGVDYRVQGEVTSKLGLAYVEVQLGHDKIFSRSAEERHDKPTSIEFDAPAVLERGPNRVLVKARTADGVEIARSWWVLGEKK